MQLLVTVSCLRHDGHQYYMSGSYRNGEAPTQDTGAEGTGRIGIGGIEGGGIFSVLGPSVSVVKIALYLLESGIDGRRDDWAMMEKKLSL